jgi:hypothetical protein
MAFLRRRGNNNMSSETDVRRHTFFESSASGDITPALSSQPFQNNHEGAGEFFHSPPCHDLPRDSTASRLEDHRESHAESRPDIEGQGESRPDTPPIQDENSKHHRFSVLRFRNASDSQLSLRVKQQSEQTPPVPRRKSSYMLFVARI